MTPPPPAVSSGAASSAHQDVPGQANPFHIPPVQAYPAWPQNIPVAMHVRITSDPSMSDILPRRTDGHFPNFIWENITFGDWKESRVVDYEIKIPKVRSTLLSVIPAAARCSMLTSTSCAWPQSVQNNASLWLDVLLVKEGVSLDPTDSSFDVNSFRHVRKRKQSQFYRKL